MTVRTRNAFKAIPKELLEAILEGLTEIEAHFDLEGFSSPLDEPLHVKPTEELPKTVSEDGDFADYEADGSEGYGGTTIFEREDIEVAIDLFISHLAKEHIKNFKFDDAPTFEEVFGRVFGDKHAITKKAQAFEEDIVGYFGRIYYEDMVAASVKLAEIRRMIEGIRNR